MDPNFIQRVTVMAVGVETYQHMTRLRGPRVDVNNLHGALVTSPRTALYQQAQFLQFINPTAEILRQGLTSYSLSRSAPGDILIFYFSGHGIAVGHEDFGFCTVDTTIHPRTNSVMPLTVLKFSDLLTTLSVAEIIPVVIIDACYSGRAGGALISAQNMIASLQNKITTSSASNCALLCACSDIQTVPDGRLGGVFSRCLFQIIDQGIANLQNNPHLIGIRNIYAPLTQLVEAQAVDATPKLFMGNTLLDFPVAKNILYRPQRYSFVGHLRSVVSALWNNGNERELGPEEISELCGKGAYGNHQKLSLEPWQLVDTNPDTHKRRLTNKGKQFVRGKITIPRNIEKDPASGRWVPESDTPNITFED